MYEFVNAARMLGIAAVLLTGSAQAQGGAPAMDHSAHGAGAKLIEAGQGAFAAISEVVRVLKADPATDWSKVNIESLRQHLIDMDEVTLRSSVAATPVPGGVTLTVTGVGRTRAAIQRMVTKHAAVLHARPEYAAVVVQLPTGVRLTVTAEDTRDARLIDAIRGLGFAGLMTEGAHHAEHHIAIARGDTSHRH